MTKDNLIGQRVRLDKTKIQEWEFANSRKILNEIGVVQCEVIEDVFKVVFPSDYCYVIRSELILNEDLELEDLV